MGKSKVLNVDSVVKQKESAEELLSNSSKLFAILQLLSV